MYNVKMLRLLILMCILSRMPIFGENLLFEVDDSYTAMGRAATAYLGDIGAFSYNPAILAVEQNDIITVNTAFKSPFTENGNLFYKNSYCVDYTHDFLGVRAAYQKAGTRSNDELVIKDKNGVTVTSTNNRDFDQYLLETAVGNEFFGWYFGLTAKLTGFEWYSVGSGTKISVELGIIKQIDNFSFGILVHDIGLYNTNYKKREYYWDDAGQVMEVESKIMTSINLGLTFKLSDNIIISGDLKNPPFPLVGYMRDPNVIYDPEYYPEIGIGINLDFKPLSFKIGYNCREEIGEFFSKNYIQEPPFANKSIYNCGYDYLQKTVYSILVKYIFDMFSFSFASSLLFEQGKWICPDYLIFNLGLNI
jgi:hypothetical protein